MNGASRTALGWIAGFVAVIVIGLGLAVKWGLWG
jgi:Flp pilus assembly pilin Flp